MTLPDCISDESAEAAPENGHSRQSSYREKIVEHTFIGQVLRRLWAMGIHSAEVMKPEVDGGGYDLAIKAKGITRHIQLKSLTKGAKTNRWSVSLDLADCHSGCVVVIILDPQTLDIGPFLWFGAAGDCSLPPINHLPVTKHPKANAAGEKLERERHRTVGRKLFTEVPDVDGLVDLLFSEPGELLHPASINHGLWRELTKRGQPFVEISWNSPEGCLSAFCTPGVLSAEINGQRTSYMDLIIDIAHQVGSKIGHMSAPIGVPLAFDVVPITDPVKALEFISLCQVNGIVVLPLTTHVATDFP